MEAGPREVESRRVAGLLVYLRTALKLNVREDLIADSKNYYGNADRVDGYTRTLCDMVLTLTEDQQSRLLWDGHNKDARNLATWWEEHQERDNKRLEKEIRDKARDEIVSGAMKKLTHEERIALGL